MKIGSIFSGAGGLDLAVEQIFGGTTIWHVENDPAASKVLSHRWPGVPNHHDITTIDWTTVQPVDVLCGGWPCQPFSQAGKRLGAADERALWPHVAGAVRLLRPRYVVLENVSAVLTAGEFQRVADDLAQAGYEFGWVCVRASDVGAPHRRERVFILATDGDRERHVPEGLTWGMDTPQSSLDGSSSPFPADSSGDGRDQGRPESAGFQRGSDAAQRGDRPVNLLPTPRSSDCFGAGLHGDGGPDLRTTISLLPTPNAAKTGNDIGLTCSGDERDTPNKLGWAVSGLLSNPQSRDYKGVPSDGFNVACLARDVVSTQWGKYGPAIHGWEQVVGPAPPPTEPNTKGKPRLNPAFSEWMMGWPPGWVTAVPGISRNDQLRIIGNGCVPQQAIAALTWLLEVAQHDQAV